LVRRAAAFLRAGGRGMLLAAFAAGGGLLQLADCST